MFLISLSLFWSIEVYISKVMPAIAEKKYFSYSTKTWYTISQFSTCPIDMKLSVELLNSNPLGCFSRNLKK